MPALYIVSDTAQDWGEFVNNVPEVCSVPWEESDR